MTATLSIDHIGPLVSIQDAGRRGYMRYGVTGAGPMDRTGHALANLALDKPVDAAAIEVSLGGLSLHCTDGETTAAIAGGHFDIKLDNKTQPPWCQFKLQAGNRLTVRPGLWGSWCYIAFDGRLQSHSWLGSQALIQGTNLCGTPLQQHNNIQIEHDRPSTTPGSIELLDPAQLRPDNILRVVAGPQDRFFTEQSIRALYNEPFTLTSDYNRMGIRLSGPSLSINTELNMPSAPITRGSIQVPGHGDPICLMADHQTTGGYPKIATIISADQDKLAQCRTGDSIIFEPCDPAQAVLAARSNQHRLETLVQTIQMNRVSLTERLRNSNLISGVVNAVANPDNSS